MANPAKAFDKALLLLLRPKSLDTKKCIIALGMLSKIDLANLNSKLMQKRKVYCHKPLQRFGTDSGDELLS